MLARPSAAARARISRRGRRSSRERCVASGVIIGAYTLHLADRRRRHGQRVAGRRSDGRYEGQVAIKLLNAALVGRGGEERFRREGIILARLGHPHIASLIDAGVSNTGQPYLVLELVERRAYRRLLRRAAAVDRAAHPPVSRRAVGGLARARQPDRASRSKPSNVLVDQAGAVKLLDFSIAKLMEDDGVSRLTQEAGAALTPEVRGARAGDGRADHDRHRRLLARRAALRVAERAASLRRPPSKTSKDYTRAIVDQDPLPRRRGVSEERRRVAQPGRRPTRDHARPAGPRAWRRAGNDSAQGLKKIAGGAIRFGRGDGRRPAALSRPISRSPRGRTPSAIAPRSSCGGIAAASPPASRRSWCSPSLVVRSTRCSWPPNAIARGCRRRRPRRSASC